MRLALLLAALILASATADAAKIYKWIDERGNPVYSDQPHPGAEEIDVSTDPAGIVPVPEEKLRRPRPLRKGASTRSWRSPVPPRRRRSGTMPAPSRSPCKWCRRWPPPAVTRFGYGLTAPRCRLPIRRPISS